MGRLGKLSAASIVAAVAARKRQSTRIALKTFVLLCILSNLLVDNRCDCRWCWFDGMRMGAFILTLFPAEDDAASTPFFNWL